MQKVLYIDMDNVLVNFKSAIPHVCSGLIYTDTSIGGKSTIRGVLNDKATKKI
jgi:hypothetical protein